MDAIAEIYGALDDELAFARLPEILASAAGARSGILQVFDAKWEVQDVHLNYFTSEMLARYINQDIWRLDPWKAPALRGLNTVMAMDSTVPVGQFVKSAFYNENFRFWGDDTAHCMAGAYDLPDGFLTIGVHRGLGAPDFTVADLHNLRTLAPHVKRLFELQGLLHSAGTTAALSAATLDHSPHAIFVVDMKGRPLVMNQHAADMIGRSDSLALTRVGLRALHESSAKTLSLAIETACTRTGPQGGALRVARSAGAPLRAVVSPLIDGGRTFALIVVEDPTRPRLALLATLRGLYDLTRAEAETAAALAQGRSPAEIAKGRGVAIATTRTQIRQILQKTATRTLTELSAAVASAPTLS